MSRLSAHTNLLVWLMVHCHGCRTELTKSSATKLPLQLGRVVCGCIFPCSVGVLGTSGLRYLREEYRVTKRHLECFRGVTEQMAQPVLLGALPCVCLDRRLGFDPTAGWC